MALRVVGAGLGRTGTMSLKGALELLLGGRCYHMVEVFGQPSHPPQWRDAALGRPVDWAGLLDGYVATVDWPAASFWRELAAANPDAVILLSTRRSAEEWWRSADATIFRAIRQPAPESGPGAEWRAMWDALAEHRFVRDCTDAGACMAAYDAHNAAVRAEADPARLVEWQPGDGWGPLCRALGVPEPDAAFPHENSTADFQARMARAAPPPS